jgi:polysaccharide deacetylase 2 family uncharacterized protein YibQ
MLPWIFLLAGWGGVMALFGGIVAYLWLASDSIMQELKDDRPQITIQVQPKRRVIEPPTTEKKPAPTQFTERTGASPESLESPNQKSKTAAKTGNKLSENLASDRKFGATNDQLHPHPDEKLIAESDQGPLPKIDDTGRQAWRVYASPFNMNDQRPRVAVVVTQLGLSPQLTRQAITGLPAPVTLGFAPYAQSLDDWIKQARENGHEVLLGLPMEPHDYPRNDPGPNGLMLTNSQEENTKRLNWVLSRATGYVGVFNFMGSRFANEKLALLPIVQQLKDRGLMILDTSVSPSSVLGFAAREVGLPYAVVNISADSEPNRGAIDRKLRQVTELATKKKSIVVVVRPFKITMLRLEHWLNQLDPNQIVLAPLSAVTTMN